MKIKWTHKKGSSKKGLKIKRGGVKKSSMTTTPEKKAKIKKLKVRMPVGGLSGEEVLEESTKQPL